jgi:hypothetical protein
MCAIGRIALKRQPNAAVDQLIGGYFFGRAMAAEGRLTQEQILESAVRQTRPASLACPR